MWTDTAGKSRPTGAGIGAGAGMQARAWAAGRGIPWEGAGSPALVQAARSPTVSDFPKQQRLLESIPRHGGQRGYF